jgi:hypothetical protein
MRWREKQSSIRKGEDRAGQGTGEDRRAGGQFQLLSNLARVFARDDAANVRRDGLQDGTDRFVRRANKTLIQEGGDGITISQDELALMLAVKCRANLLKIKQHQERKPTLARIIGK